MKKFLAFILAVVYLSTSIAAVQAGSACPECRDMLKSGKCCLKEIKADRCKNEVTQVRTEEHHRTSAGAFRLNPLFPVTFAAWRYSIRENIAAVISSSFVPTPVAMGGIPLFVRHCNFRI